ncbi:MAG TPA: GspH/FimT family pseudopilin [Longimicrobium sp.]|nr:GspH/FimT family pseudopilin [Longimicrobium sp.]
MPHNPFSLRPGRAGFTLAEMTIVLVIAALLLALGLPQLRNWNNAASARTATNEVKSDLEYTRLRAVQNGNLASFRITSATTYVITVDRTAATDTVKKVNLAQTHPGATLTPSTARIVFDSRGLYRSATSNADSVVITKGERKKTLKVLTLGGIRRAN